MNSQTYTVIRVDQSPFYADPVGKDCLILVDTITRKPYASLNRDADVADGDVVDEADIVDEQFSNKKSKLLVEGDLIRCGPHKLYTGRIDRIERVSEDEWSWDDVFMVSDITFEGPTELLKGSMFKTDRVLRRDCEHKPYRWVEINVTNEKKWKRIREAFDRAQWNGNMTPAECFEFLQKLTDPK